MGRIWCNLLRQLAAEPASAVAGPPETDRSIPVFHAQGADRFDGIFAPV